MPDALLDIARRDYGSLGGGNHFLEVQVVADVLDPAAAAVYGLAEGQLAIHFHTGSGMFGYEVGRLYSYRRKVSPRLLPRSMARKLVFHAGHAVGMAAFARRYRLFVEPKRFSWVETESLEGEEMLAALAQATNFGYANRSAVASAAAAAVSAAFGDTGVRLVYDSNHNSISLENGQWIHRHNAVRCAPSTPGDAFKGFGAPVLVPGLDRSSSYICRPGAGASAALDSVDHGAGGAVKTLGAERDDGRVTTRYHFSRPREEVGHLTDVGIECVVATLAAADLAHPVVRMTPLAVLKE
jgi:tRNA-splicing ligase RtcB